MRARVQVRSPHHKKSFSLGSRLSDGMKTISFPGSENSSGELNFDISREMLKGQTEADDGCGNKVMVVVDSNMESKGALQWALDHTVQNQDTMILVHIATGSKLGCKSSGQVNQRAYEHLCSLKKNLETKRHEVKVEIEVRQGKEKGPTIVEAAKQDRVSLLVLGQRKQSLFWKIRTIWAGKRSKGRVVDYCIQNANCMTIAVVELYQKCDILTQEVDSLKCNVSKLQDEALNFLKFKKNSDALDDMLSRQNLSQDKEGLGFFKNEKTTSVSLNKPIKFVKEGQNEASQKSAPHALDDAPTHHQRASGLSKNRGSFMILLNPLVLNLVLETIESSPSVKDDRISEPIVQDFNESSSLQANDLDKGYPKSVKDTRGHPIEQAIGELNEITLRSKTKQA
nr:hypothetical protein [Tanacetum cinerariifolium]